jgi:Ice-binding-like
MKTLKRGALFVLLTLLPACGRQLVEFPQADGAQPDTARADVVTADHVNSDAKNGDVANTDVAGIDDANTDVVSFDEGIADAGNRDSISTEIRIADVPVTDDGSRDANSTDTPSSDARLFDVRIIDGSVNDTLLVDISLVDAAKTDLASGEAKSIDLGNIDGSGSGPAIVVNLGLATPFAIAATAGVTSTITTPITHINGNVVLTPNQTCNAVTVDNAGGFGLCGGMPPTINGTVITSVYPDTTTATAIKAALNAAFLSITPLAGPPAVGSLGGGTPIAAPTTLGNVAGSPLVAGDNWFTPGVYTSITSILITGDLTLDGQGDPNAVFVFQSASTLTTADGAASPGAHARILLTKGTKASNVWWQVASSATLGSYSEFQGNILAAFNITMKTGGTACGRSMAGAWVGGAGAYIFDSNMVSVPGNGCPL